MDDKKVISIIEDLVFEDINNKNYWKAVDEAKDLIKKVKAKQLILHDFSTRSFKKGDKVIVCNKLEGTVVSSETRTMVKVKIKGTTIGINARSLELKSI